VGKKFHFDQHLILSRLFYVPPLSTTFILPLFSFLPSFCLSYIFHNVLRKTQDKIMASIASNLKTTEYLTQTQHYRAHLHTEVPKTNAMRLASQTTVAVCWTIC
jgi:hypothetical protein